MLKMQWWISSSCEHAVVFMKHTMFYIFLVCHVYSKASMFLVSWFDIVDHVSEVTNRIPDPKSSANNVYLNIPLSRF